MGMQSGNVVDQGIKPAPPNATGAAIDQQG
jgi:hypothetical protein